MSVDVLDFGGRVRTLKVPDRTENRVDVVLGYDDLAGYEDDHTHFGGAIGRYANRISRGKFVLDGKSYQLATNNGPNHLHGGVRGFDKLIWSSHPFEDGDSVGVVMYHTSPDGDEGYPGSLTVEMTYTLSSSDVFSVAYRASTDAPTPVNLTHHGYFDLSGEGSGGVLDHEMMINASSFTEIDDTLIPTGRLLPVDGTPLDFRQSERIGKRIDDDFEQLEIAGGYDHNFVLSNNAELTLAARALSPKSGISMEVFTTEPGVQFYSGNSLKGPLGKNGHRYDRRTGFCLETQHFPDSPNHPEFPSTILRPGEEFHSRTEFHFSAQ